MSKESEAFEKLCADNDIRPYSIEWSEAEYFWQARGEYEAERAKELVAPWAITSPRYKNIIRRYIPWLYHAMEALAKYEGRK